MSSSDINNQNKGLVANTYLKATSGRQTQKTDAGTIFQLGLSKTAQVAGMTAGVIYPAAGNVLLSAASTLATNADNSPSVNMGGAGGGSSALVGGGGGASASLGMVGGGSSGSPAVGGSSAPGGYLGDVAHQAAGGSASAQMMMATQQMQEMNQTFNLQYLNLQQKMQDENRSYTALSNIMKTKHDTAKNALSNLK